VPEFTIEFVTHDWYRFDEVLDLSYAVLYEPFGIDRGGEWYHPANGSDFAVALDAGSTLVGTARLLPMAADLTRQVRQVCVMPSMCGRGIGRALVGALEELAVASGAGEMWLHARQDAVGFYERMGYIPEGPVFVSELTGIPHRTMRRSIG